MKRLIPTVILLAVFAGVLGLVYGCSTIDTVGCSVGLTSLCSSPTATPTPAPVAAK